MLDKVDAIINDRIAFLQNLKLNCQDDKTICDMIDNEIRMIVKIKKTLVCPECGSPELDIQCVHCEWDSDSGKE